MKKFIVLIVVFVIAMSCNDQPKTIQKDIPELQVNVADSIVNEQRKSTLSLKKELVKKGFQIFDYVD